MRYARKLAWWMIGVTGGLVAACVGDAPADSTDGGGNDAATGDAANDGGSGGDGSLDAGADSGPVYNPWDPVGIATGGAHACAVRADHKVYCWGDNSNGDLGPNAAGSMSAAPVEVSFQAGVRPVSLFSGPNFTCAIADDGSAWCWGSNQNFGLGINNASTGNFPTPQRMQTASGPVTAQVPGIGAGASSNGAGGLLIQSDGTVLGWGSSPYGAFGFASASSQAAVPAAVTNGNTPVLALSSGGYHSLAIVTHAGNVGLATWGGNGMDELGSPDATNGSPNPVYPALPNGGTVAYAAAGGTHTCAVDTMGRLSCWGSNATKECGNGPSGSPVPTPTANTDFGGEHLTAVAAGSDSTCVISAGMVWCFGNNSFGELGGLGAGSSNATKQQIESIASDAVAISAGYQFYCVIRDSVVAGGRTVWCWGANYDQQLGAFDAGSACSGGACSTTPVKVNLPTL